MDEKKVMSRRDFLANAGAVAAGVAIAGSGLGLFAPAAHAQGGGLPEYPWAQYFNKPLDVEKVRANGAAFFAAGQGCAEAAFAAILVELGEPFSLIPTQILNWGKAGGVGWGTLCGAINGAAAAVSLVFGREQATTVIINEVMHWYSETPLPLNAEVNSVAGNPLCHSSISNWCKASGKKASERGPRCSALTGDVAAQTAKYMNELLAGTFVPVFEMSAETQACFNCHTGMVDDTLGKMDCAGCHEGH